MPSSWVVDCAVSQTQARHAYTPNFGKPKDECWMLVLGDTDSGDVVALRRAHGRGGAATLAFTPPPTAGRRIYTLYLLSDCYTGLDQQYDVPLCVVLSDTAATGDDS